jgi:DNA-binding transcriptional MerR regulator
MSEPGSYTLEELASAFNLTPRTARHYIANVLPPRHKTGRGRRARYGQDTWNCFAFIRKARRDRLTMRQISNLLGTLGPSQVEQVVQGLEELSIVPTAPEPREVYSSPCMAG